MAERRRISLSFSMLQPHQREAGKVLSAIPKGQRTDVICRMVHQNQFQQELMDAVRNTIREELQDISYTPVKTEQPEGAGNVNDDVLGFLLALQNEGDDDD